jgi:NadR type nicotinamide-nucleotide adenylyltransferase
MVKKVVLFGSESTGKTTLAAQLATCYHTVWVPEYSRIYQEEQQRLLTPADVIPIAKGQMQLEEKALPYANQFLICDTDILETKVYSEAYYGSCPTWLVERIPLRLADLYLLAEIDLPWEPDGIRDRPHSRVEMHNRFRNELLSRKLPFVTISGSFEDRLKKAVAAVNTLLHQGYC